MVQEVLISAKPWKVERLAVIERGLKAGMACREIEEEKRRDNPA